MSLTQWASNGWLRPHQTTRRQIVDLLAIVERDLEDSAQALSADWQFGIAYNAALKLCTILLYASGFRPEKNLAHQGDCRTQKMPPSFTQAPHRRRRPVYGPASENPDSSH